MSNEVQMPGRDRLVKAYADALRRYLAAEKALAEAADPVDVAFVMEHNAAAEDFRTIRAIVAAEIKRATALAVVEQSAARPEGEC